jgi:hypothetical protein
MNRTNATAAVMRALRLLRPDATPSIMTERPWYSLTFSGVQLCVSLTASDAARAADLQAFAQRLSAYEFHLQGQIVADIALRQDDGINPDGILLIDILVLDE